MQDDRVGRGVNVFMKEKSIIHAAALNSKPHLPSTRRENVLENSDWVMGLDQDIYSPLSTSKMIRGRDEGMGGWGKGMGREGERGEGGEKWREEREGEESREREEREGGEGPVGREER